MECIISCLSVPFIAIHPTLASEWYHTHLCLWEIMLCFLQTCPCCKLNSEPQWYVQMMNHAYCSWDMVSNSQSNSVLRRYYLTSQFVFSIFPYFRGCRILQNSSYTIYVLFNCHNVPYITEKHSGQSFLRPITQRPTSSLLPTGLGDQVDVQPSFCSVMYQLICWYLSS